jgi:hypothetical protein
VRDRNEALIFLHIPKTGGSTLSKILAHHYSPAVTVTLDTPGVAQFKTLSGEERGRYRLIQGHLYFGLHRLIPRASTYITLLRNPIDRTLSFYYYARSTPGHYLYRLLTTERLDLKTLLVRNLTSELSNDQTRFLAGDEWEDPQQAVTRGALERAKVNLRSHFCMVGLQEQFDASLLLLRRAFGWDLPFYLKDNVTKVKPPDPSLDVETRRLIEDANSLDLELYQYARSLFEEQCRTAGNSFAEDLYHFRHLNGHYARPVPRLAISFRRMFRRLQHSLSLGQ